MGKRWSIHARGCGTVGCALARRIRSLLKRDLPHEVTCADNAKIRQHNLITCPDWIDYLGWWKSDAMAAFLQENPSLQGKVESYPIAVEDEPWRDRLGADELRRGDEFFVLIGLDDWSSRLVVTQDVRQRASEAGDGAAEQVLLIQIGLDRGKAHVFAFGADWDSPCPACWLPSGLPMREPCVVFSSEGGLLRGNLQREAQAAADLALQIIGDHRLGNTERWRNTKTHLTLSGSRVRTRTRKVARMPNCQGPHAKETPISWKGVLPSLEGVISEITC